MWVLLPNISLLDEMFERRLLIDLGNSFIIIIIIIIIIIKFKNNNNNNNNINNNK